MAYPFWLSIFFCLISSNIKDEIISSNFKIVVFLHIATTRLSHESGREHNKLMHVYSSKNFVSIGNNWLTIVLKVFICSDTESLSFIFRLYNFFCKKNLFTKYLYWYKFANFTHKSFVAASPHTFNNTESEIHNCIVHFSFRSNFTQSSYDIVIGLVSKSIMIH